MNSLMSSLEERTRKGHPNFGHYLVPLETKTWQGNPLYYINYKQCFTVFSATEKNIGSQTNVGKGYFMHVLF